MSKFIELVNNSSTRSHNKKAMADKVVIERCNFLVSRIKELDKLEWSQYVEKVELLEYLSCIDGYDCDNRYKATEQVVLMHFDNFCIVSIFINYVDDMFVLSMYNKAKRYTGDWPHIFKILSELKIVPIEGTDYVSYTYDD